MAELHSMTGFSRVDGITERITWTWEIKSVNGRNLDLRIRVPFGFDQLDPLIRKAVSGQLTRGSLSINLSIKSAGPSSQVRVNRDVLDTVIAAVKDIQERLDVDKARPEGLLGLRGVLEQAEDLAVEGDPALTAAVFAGFEKALCDLQATRGSEGALLRPVLLEQVEAIAGLAERARAVPGHQPGAIRDRLQNQVETMLQDQGGFDATRLHQEIVLLVNKSDVREEIDRLISHCQTARDLLAKGGPCGRRLDHLSQEFNREANTLCSKSNDVEMTGIGLDLKAVIDQFREQVQNLE